MAEKCPPPGKPVTFYECHPDDHAPAPSVRADFDVFWQLFTSWFHRLCFTHSTVNSDADSVEMEPGTIGWSSQASCQTKRCWPKTVESLAVPQGSVPHSPKVAGLQNIFGRQKCSGSGSGCPEALANESSRIKQYNSTQMFWICRPGTYILYHSGPSLADNPSFHELKPCAMCQLLHLEQYAAPWVVRHSKVGVSMAFLSSFGGFLSHGGTVLRSSFKSFDHDLVLKAMVCESPRTFGEPPHLNLPGL